MRETRQTVAHHRFSRWNYFPVLWQPLSVFTFSSRSLFLPRFVTTLEFHGNRCEKLSIILLSQNFYGIINSWYRNEMYFGNKQLNIVKIFYAYQRWKRCRNSYYFITMKLKLNTFKSETVITIALLFLKKQKKKFFHLKGNGYGKLSKLISRVISNYDSCFAWQRYRIKISNEPVASVIIFNRANYSLMKSKHRSKRSVRHLVCFRFRSWNVLSLPAISNLHCRDSNRTVSARMAFAATRH